MPPIAAPGGRPEAEASVLAAGAARYPFRRFAVATGLGNLGIAAVYAAVGSFAYEAGSFLLAFAGAIAIPLAAIAAMRLAGRPVA